MRPCTACVVPACTASPPPGPDLPLVASGPLAPPHLVAHLRALSPTPLLSLPGNLLSISCHILVSPSVSLPRKAGWWGSDPDRTQRSELATRCPRCWRTLLPAGSLPSTPGHRWLAPLCGHHLGVGNTQLNLTLRLRYPDIGSQDGAHSVEKNSGGNSGASCPVPIPETLLGPRVTCLVLEWPPDQHF